MWEPSFRASGDHAVHWRRHAPRQGAAAEGARARSQRAQKPLLRARSSAFARAGAVFPRHRGARRRRDETRAGAPAPGPGPGRSRPGSVWTRRGPAHAGSLPKHGPAALPRFPPSEPRMPHLRGWGSVTRFSRDQPGSRQIGTVRDQRCPRGTGDVHVSLARRSLLHRETVFCSIRSRSVDGGFSGQPH